MIKKTCAALLPIFLEAFPSLVFAQATGLSFNPPGNGPGILPGFYGVFENVVGWIFVVAIVLGVLTFIVSGLMYVTAGRDPAKGSRAAKMAMSAVIGISIAALAWALVNVVGSYFADKRFIAPDRIDVRRS